MGLNLPGLTAAVPRKTAETVGSRYVMRTG
jgi:hypothetical protein